MKTAPYENDDIFNDAQFKLTFPHEIVPTLLLITSVEFL